MHNITRTSSVAALAFFVVVGLVAALAIAWPNLARAHSVAGAALTGLTVSPGTLTPAFSSTVHYYTVPLADTVTQITIEATPDGDGTVAYEEADETALTDADPNTDGLQVDIPADGKRVNVVVIHDDAGVVMEETYGVLVIREGPAVPDTIVLMALYDSTDGPNWGGDNGYWTDDNKWGSTVPIGDWTQVNTDANGRVTYLGLWNNNLVGTLPAGLGNLDQLTDLYLSDNQLSGSIPDLGRLSQLDILRMWNNQLSGEIPDSLSNLTKLRTLELWDNQLTGPIPDLSRNPNLEFLDLHNNQLSGAIPNLSGLTNLTNMYLNDNQLTGPIPALSDLTSLERLHLWNNQLSGEVPASLGSLTNLRYLSLPNNQLSGTIPEALGNLTNLTELSLWGNKLTGEVPASLGNLTQLRRLWLGGNALSGRLPASLGNLTELRELSLWDNELSGRLPASLNNLTHLYWMDVSRNQLDGPIPDLSGTNLYNLFLWDNQLTGPIPASLNNLTNLRELYLNRNALSGPIPDLGRLTNLTHLYLNHNQLSDEIPPSLGSLTSLEELSLSSNGLSGAIPAGLNSLTSLTYLYLSANQLSGPIPTLSSLTSLERLWLQSNDLTGGIPGWLSSLTTLTSLGLDTNELTGPIPDLSRLVNLTTLSLQNNQLTGPIPAWLGQLTSLEELSLSSNQLSGDFPATLGNLINLKLTRFASNPSLTGCVPLGLRYLLTAPDYESSEYDPDRHPLNHPAQDFIADDANGDGDTDDRADISGLNLPFCMLGALEFSDVTLEPAFASGTAAYTASVANTVESTTVTATLNNDGDRLSIRKGRNSYTSGGDLPLDVGSNVISIEVTPADARLLKQTYTVRVFREGSAATDRAALMALYDSTGGASWTDKANWNSAEPLDTWFGVTLLGNDRVAELDLSANNVRGTLPANLGSLTSLSALDLSENQLRGQIPDVRGLTVLTALNLGDNQLSGTIPDWLGSLTGLQELSLRDNRLTGPIPEELGDLLQLRDLSLDDNQLSGAIPDWLSDLLQLRILYLNGNQLSGCVPDESRAGLMTNHDFFAVDANSDGDTADAGDTPGLPFCTLNALAFSGDVTLNPEFTSSTTTYTASAAHDVATTTVTADLNNFSNTVSITKDREGIITTYMNGDPVPLDVGSNVITTEVTRPDDPLTPHSYTVTVTRAPNTPPAFDDGPTATRGVVENTATGEYIGDPVAATDAENDTLTYSLDDTGAESFDIVSTSGQLRTKADLDYETRDSYRVTVSVSDGMDADGNADEMTDNTITVTILVSNVNEAPVFLSALDSLTIREDTPVGGDIGAPFTATDGDNDTLTYTLDGSGAATFAIHAASGQLRTRSVLDYETTPSYTVDVNAADPSGEADSITVTITVTNVDEAGTVTLSSVQPVVGQPLRATMTDPDYISGSETWSWARSPNGTTSWTPIGGETLATYTPVVDDVGDYLRATASYTDGEGSDKSAPAISVNPVRTPVPGNQAPVFPSIEPDLHDVNENTPAGEDIGPPVMATDADNDTLTYTLDEGAETFDIVSTTGQLRTKAALDFETTDFYYARVNVTDTAGATGSTAQITIYVNNVEEPGTVTLSSLQPIVGQLLTATVSDPDDISDSETWSWARSPNGTTSWTPIGGETLATYTPVVDDVGDYLRATASYDDGEGSNKSAPAISANAVEVAPGRNKPVFREHPTATRSTPRNTPAGRNIGAPLSATDADNDALTYSLGGPDGAGFDLDTSSGQLLTKAVLTGINRTVYKVFVSVSDGKDDLGDPEPAPQIDTTTEVTITVTTPRSSRRSGGGSSGGGSSSSRATPTPTPTPSPTPTPTGPQFSGVIVAEPSVTATVVPEGTTLGVNGGGDLPGGVYVNFPPTAVALPVQVSVSVSNEAPDDVEAPSGTTLLPLTIDITPETPLTLGTPLTIEINPTPEQLEAAGGDLNHLAVGVVTPNGIVVLPTQVMHGRLVVTTNRLAPFVLVAITDPVPVLRQPPMDDASSMGPLLQWTQPPETTWFQVQVIPFNEDGPGINLVIGDGALVSAAQYQVLGPNFGSADPNYVMLPDMTYLWRVRTSTVLTNPTEADWSAWAVSSFRTPPASSSTITRVSPALFGEVRTLTPTLTWANSNPAVFYYEVQVSRDFEFGPNAFLYSEYVHGGASTPANSYVVPEAFPLEAGAIYYWRVRPRIQGDGDPLPWSRINVFQTPSG